MSPDFASVPNHVIGFESHKFQGISSTYYYLCLTIPMQSNMAVVGVRYDYILIYTLSNIRQAWKKRKVGGIMGAHHRRGNVFHRYQDHSAASTKFKSVPGIYRQMHMQNGMSSY